MNRMCFVWKSLYMDIAVKYAINSQIYVYSTTDLVILLWNRFGIACANCFFA